MPDTDTQGEKDFFTGIAATAGRACGSLTVVRPSETIAGVPPVTATATRRSAPTHVSPMSAHVHGEGGLCESRDID
jgi:hypothetical protein